MTHGRGRIKVRHNLIGAGSDRRRPFPPAETFKSRLISAATGRIKPADQIV